MKCVGVCGLVAQCEEYQLVVLKKIVLTVVLSIYIPCGNPLFSSDALYSWCVGACTCCLWLHSASVAL